MLGDTAAREDGFRDFVNARWPALVRFAWTLVGDQGLLGPTRSVRAVTKDQDGDDVSDVDLEEGAGELGERVGRRTRRRLLRFGRP